MKTVKLVDLAKTIRSKNAGTDRITFDIIFREKENYETYALVVKGLIIAGIISSVLWIIGLVWLTIIAGKNPYNEEIEILRFDRWKTEIATVLALGVCVAIGVGAGLLYADNIYSAHYYEYI